MSRLGNMFAIQRRTRGDLVKLILFLVAAGLMASYVYVIQGGVRDGERSDYRAAFTDVSGLEVGDEVRVAGVHVGKVQSIKIRPDSSVIVGFNLLDTIEPTRAIRATVHYKNLIGDRYLALEQPRDSTETRLPRGGTIPASRTAPSLNLDTLLNGFKPLFAGLNPQQINTLSEQLIAVLQGQSSSVSTLVATISSFTTTIGNRDELVGQVLENLNVAMRTFDRRALGTVIDELSALAEGLDDQAPDLTRAIVRIDSAAASATNLLSEARSDITPSLRSLRATSTNLNNNSEYVERMLDAYPEHYKRILRTGSFGNFFNFFLCGVRLRFTEESETENVAYSPWFNSDLARCQR